MNRRSVDDASIPALPGRKQLHQCLQCTAGVESEGSLKMVALLPQSSPSIQSCFLQGIIALMPPKRAGAGGIPLSLDSQ